ncbi:MAG: DUF4230 domain-containing protein [Tannerella sp.]|jgi:hypothetical protein|nr:DUF4230 domain-containing protein [Tannerella sp.]
MMRKLKWWIIACIIIVLLIITGYLVYNRFNQPAIKTLPAKIEEIKQAVKLSTLDITMEDIYKDTVNIKGVVSRIKAQIYIRFDIENIPMVEHGDTLIVQLPPECIEIYESTSNSSEILDVWNLQFPEEPVETPLSTAEENYIKQRYKQRIENQMYEKGYVKRARENALQSLAILFSKFRDHVIIVDNYPDGWRNEEQPHILPEYHQNNQ